MTSCPQCRRRVPGDPAVLAHAGARRCLPGGNCLCNDYCFEQGDSFCQEAVEHTAYMARLLGMSVPEYWAFVEDTAAEEPEPLRAAADPRYRDCSNCGRPVHLPYDAGGCRRTFRCSGFSVEKMRAEALLDDVEF